MDHEKFLHEISTWLVDEEVSVLKLGTNNS